MCNDEGEDEDDDAGDVDADMVKEIKASRPSKKDFDTLKVIGRGAFGEVSIV